MRLNKAEIKCSVRDFIIDWETWLVYYWFASFVVWYYLLIEQHCCPLWNAVVLVTEFLSFSFELQENLSCRIHLILVLFTEFGYIGISFNCFCLCIWKLTHKVIFNISVTKSITILYDHSHVQLILHDNFLTQLIWEL